jgi:hypothetical protein
VSIPATTEDRKPDALLDLALAGRHRGWSIIPTVGKRARFSWRDCQTSPAPEDLLRDWFGGRWGGITGLAVICGRVSGGLAVRDFDRADAYHRWADAHSRDAAWLPTVQTARGFHVYGRVDTEQYVTLDDGELRADVRHYVLLPPSIHPSGFLYTWTVPLTQGPLPPLPRSLTQTQADPGTPSTHIACATCTGADAIHGAIARTLPRGPGQRNRKLFELARALKGIIPEAEREALREIVRTWHRLAFPTIRTKDFAESWSDFITAWRRVEKPLGASFRAAALADHEPAVARRRYDGLLRRLATLCWHLQGQSQGRPFFLSCRKAAAFLNVSPIHACRLLHALQFDGVMQLVSKGTKSTGKASEWHFIDPEQKDVDP